MEIIELFIGEAAVSEAQGIPRDTLYDSRTEIGLDKVLSNGDIRERMLKEPVVGSMDDDVGHES